MNAGVHELTGVMREKYRKDILRTYGSFLLQSIKKSIKKRPAETSHPTDAWQLKTRIDIPIPKRAWRNPKVERSRN